jgi:hypothetical protein
LQNGSNCYQVFLRTIVRDPRGAFWQFPAKTRNIIFLIIFQKISEKKVLRFYFLTSSFKKYLEKNRKNAKKVF